MLKLSDLPTVPQQKIDNKIDLYVEMYPEHKELIKRVVPDCLILQELCRLNYDNGGHRVYETTNVFSWYKFQDGEHDDKPYPQTRGSFAHYVLNNDGLLEAAIDLLQWIGIYDDHAKDIEGTAF